MRIPNPFGKKLLIPLGAVAAGLVFWRIRSRRREAEDRRFEEEIQGAVHEGSSASHSSS